MVLEDDIHGKILAFVADHKAGVSCKEWKEFLYTSLYRQHRIRFNRQLDKGSVIFSYNAVRPLGEDFEESVSYNFAFASSHTYVMQWTRTFDAWTSQSEQQCGCWSIVEDQILCETHEPRRKISDTEVRFAPAGFKFNIAIDDILDSRGIYFQDKIGAPPKQWELIARTGREATTKTLSWQESDAEATSAENSPIVRAVAAPPQEDARFVDIDGDMHEVSGDIAANWPEHEWERLMRCRLRFGING